MNESTQSSVAAPLPATMQGKVALITGGGSGIGRAAAVSFARAGAHVVVAGRRQAELDETVSLVHGEGGRGLAVSTDISSEAEISRAVEQTLLQFARLDYAFNNAGIEGAMAPITELAASDFDTVMGVNLRGTWLCLKHEIAAIQRHGEGGSIVNTSSFLARAAGSGSSIYSASKGALDAMVQALAVECGPLGIRVNNVLPGAIDTPMFHRLGGSGALSALQRHTPLGRVGQPSDVGDVAAWLCSEGARFVTGQSILVDGGISIPGIR